MPSVSGVFAVDMLNILCDCRCFSICLASCLFELSSHVFGVILQCYYVKLICAETCEMAEQFINNQAPCIHLPTDPSGIECDRSELSQVEPSRRLVSS